MSTPSFLKLPILVADDEAGILRLVSMALAGAGFRSIMTTDDSSEVMDILREHRLGVMILDLQMPGISGLEILQHVKENHPQVPVIVLTANSEIDTAVTCMKLGAFDYLVKPVDPDKLISTVRKAQEVHDLRSEVSVLRHYMLVDDLDHRMLSKIITTNEKMLNVLRYAEAISSSSFPILICGEPGTGRTLLAQVIHEMSRGKENLMTADVAGLDDEAFAATIFGDLKGGLMVSKDANNEAGLGVEGNGTLCIRNIDELGPESQARLSRLIAEKQYTKDGSAATFSSSARIIMTATPALLEAVDDGRFSPRAFQRIANHQIDLPPLRERMEDIPYLINYFVEMEASKANKEKPPLGPEFFTQLMRHHFRDNISELHDIATQAIQQHVDGPLSLDGIPLKSEDQGGTSGTEVETNLSPLFEVFGHFPTVEETVNFLIAEALKATGQNKVAAASLLQVTRQTINRRLRMKK